MNKIQTLLTTAVLLFGMNGSGIADFNDGYDAYKKGDYKTAFNEWKPLAEQAEAEAQYNLGVMYTNGRGVLKDDKQAVKWYRKAAEQGESDAQYNLALMYSKGDGVLKDYKQAVKWFRKSAEQGFANAQNNLGWLYATGQGKGVSKDLSKAKYWVEKAYENPDAENSTVELAKDNWNTFELWKY